MAMYGATVGQLGILRREMTCNQASCAMIVDPREADARFLFYNLMHHRHRITALALGAAQQNLNAGQIKSYSLPFPSVSEQQRIAGVLGAFDDLIETNHQTVESLEALATAAAYLPLETVALSAVASLGSTKHVRPTTQVDHFSIPAFDNNRRPAEDHGSNIKSGKLSVSCPTALVSRLNPITPRTWMAYPDESPAVASTEFVPLLGKQEVTTEHVWAVTNHGEFWAQMRSTASGSTNSRQRVDRNAIPEILVPDPRALKPAHRKAITAIVQGAEALRRENQNLTRQRDELLPLLMSGKVRVSEVEGSLP
ncbi:restriction endonuclease subunit S [uncultured Tessaracoccus sp.]|uniref:restriction endonuclease subunit S n=1 Tax=uncultured Tessaracoccus sp. TaxID=905023 RepID=UPI002633492A|nr:restriction endonuclease subunit S [uncultured Tessaracoccus sp.]